MGFPPSIHTYGGVKIKKYNKSKKILFKINILDVYINGNKKMYQRHCIKLEDLDD